MSTTSFVPLFMAFIIALLATDTVSAMPKGKVTKLKITQAADTTCGNNMPVTVDITLAFTRGEAALMVGKPVKRTLEIWESDTFSGDDLLWRGEYEVSSDQL